MYIITTLLLCFPLNGLGTRVFTFFEDSSATIDLSSATPTNAPEKPLPDHFIICSSHNQQQIDTLNTRTIYVLYEDSDFTKPWFAIGVWKYGSSRMLCYFFKPYLLSTLLCPTYKLTLYHHLIIIIDF